MVFRNVIGRVCHVMQMDSLMDCRFLLRQALGLRINSMDEHGCAWIECVRSELEYLARIYLSFLAYMNDDMGRR